MIYEKFNAFIKEKYFANIDSYTHVVLSVDEQVIKEFRQENSISELQLKNEFRWLFSESWNIALKTDNFFGLIAIQIYVAHLMHEKHENGKNISASNYNDSLCDYLGVSLSVIQRLYRDYQVKLWQMLKDWTIQNLFMLSLPQKSEGPWSKVKYPLSQALLNQNDLYYLPLMFANVGLRATEFLNFKDFEGIINRSESIDFLTNHYSKVKYRLEKEGNVELLYRQIFEYYRNWDGEIPEFEIKQFHRNLNRQELIKSTNILIYDELFCQVLDSSYNLIEKVDINTRNLFQIINKHYRLSHTEFIFFIKDVGDWVESKYLESGSNNLILLPKDSAYIYSFKNINTELEITSYEYYFIIQIEIPNGFKSEGWLGRYLKERNKPFAVENGLKLDRKTWMFQAGPDIKFEKMMDAWIINSEATPNIQKIELSENNLTIKLTFYPISQYVLAIRDYRKIKFEIKEPTFNNSNCIKGWKINKKPARWESSSEPFQICGLLNSFSTEQDSNSEIRDWINANMKVNLIKGQNQNNTLITNAINRAKYGIRH